MNEDSSIFQTLLNIGVPLLVCGLCIASGWLMHQFAEVKKQQREDREAFHQQAEADRIAHKDSLMYLAQNTVSRKEFEQLEKRMEETAESTRDVLVQIQGSVVRVHERIDELFKAISES